MLLVYVFELQYHGSATLPCVTTKFVQDESSREFEKSSRYVKHKYPQLTDALEVISRCIKISHLIWSSIMDSSINHRLCHRY
jgi:hypothetical protein